MAAALAASLPAPVLPTAPVEPQITKVPQRLEGFVDPEAQRDVESIKLNSLVFMKMLKHSTDTLPSPPAPSYNDRAAPPSTQLTSHVDAYGVLLGLDLDGVLEVEDSFALPTTETSVGGSSYSSNLLRHLRDIQTPDSPVGIYMSTNNGGSITKTAIDLLLSVEKLSSRGKAVIVIHDRARAAHGDLGVKAYRLSEGTREAAKQNKWDATSLAANKITPNTVLTPMPINLSSPALISAFLETLTTPQAPTQPSLTSPSVPLPPTFAGLANPLSSALPAYLHDSLDAITLYNHEANNVAFQVRQMAREKAKHDQTVRDREEDNLRRRKQGLTELPAISAEMKNGTKDPNRLELLCLQGQLDGLARDMGDEASKGLVRSYL